MCTYMVRYIKTKGGLLTYTVYSTYISNIYTVRIYTENISNIPNSFLVTGHI